MLLAYIVMAIIVLVAGFIAWLIWRFTRRIERLWIRSLIRAAGIASAITPTVAPIAGLHGALPVPVIWLLIYGLFDWGNEDRMVYIRYGGIPLLVVSAAIWLLMLAACYIRRIRSTRYST